MTYVVPGLGLKNWLLVVTSNSISSKLFAACSLILGVTILSGSDIPNFDLVPGASLHHELEIMVDAGIPPLEVIKIATSNGAQALDIGDNVGSVELGKQADMIILSDNPLDDIRNTKKIEAVICRRSIY